MARADADVVEEEEGQLHDHEQRVGEPAGEAQEDEAGEVEQAGAAVVGDEQARLGDRGERGQEQIDVAGLRRLPAGSAPPDELAEARRKDRAAAHQPRAARGDEEQQRHGGPQHGEADLVDIGPQRPAGAGEQ